MIKLNASQLRVGRSNIKIQISKIKKNEIYIILDDVIDTYNIGGIFRLADAVGAKKVFLCGKTETPPNPRIKKASINTTEIVDWSYAENASKVINDLRLMINDLQIIAIEQSAKSIRYDKFEYKMPLALVVGNESYGVSKEVSDLCDGVVEIPMYGVNISLNVIVSLGIVLFKALESEQDYARHPIRKVYHMLNTTI